MRGSVSPRFNRTDVRTESYLVACLFRSVVEMPPMIAAVALGHQEHRKMSHRRECCALGMSIHGRKP